MLSLNLRQRKFSIQPSSHCDSPGRWLGAWECAGPLQAGRTSGAGAGTGAGAGFVSGLAAVAENSLHTHRHARRGELSAPVVVSLRKAYFATENRFRSIQLENINLTVRQGDIVFLMGSKGSGKSALLELIRWVAVN